MDVGYGAGQDAKAFLSRGFEMTAIDALSEMARIATEHISQEVHHCRLQEFEPEEQFGGIWACASLLHLPKERLPDVFEQLAGWLKLSGALYMSFYSGERGATDRHFNSTGREELADLIEQTEELDRQEMWISEDAGGRKGAK